MTHRIPATELLLFGLLSLVLSAGAGVGTWLLWRGILASGTSRWLKAAAW